MEQQWNVFLLHCCCQLGYCANIRSLLGFLVQNVSQRQTTKQNKADAIFNMTGFKVLGRGKGQNVHLIIQTGTAT